MATKIKNLVASVEISQAQNRTVPMFNLRRALIFTSTERYVTLAINFVVLTIVSRLMTPEEIGLAVIGTAIYVMAQSLREFGTTAYMIQQKTLSREAARSAFTFCLMTTVVVSGSLLLFSANIALFYKSQALTGYMQILGFAMIFGTFTAPIAALMQRDMEFPALAIINVAAAAVNAVVTIALASRGYGFISFAWGHLLQSATTATLVVRTRPDFWVFRPSMSHWRSILSFGGYLSVIYALNRTCEQLPSLMLGRVLHSGSVGLFSRATMICDLPLKGMLQGIFPVILPAVALEIREGRDLKEIYLRAISYITALQWPALLMLAIVAHPVVIIILGSQWTESVPLVRLIALATLFSFPGWLTFPMLVAIGQMRDLFLCSIIALAIAATFIYAASQFGLIAVCLVLFITIPLQNFLAIWFVRIHVPFRWAEFGKAIKKSLLISAFTAGSAALTVVMTGMRLDISIAQAILASVAGAAGWATGLVVTQHPLLAQIADHLPWLKPHLAPARLTSFAGITLRRQRNV